MLNDVAVNNSGYLAVFVSNSRVIYQLIDESLEIFFADQLLLKCANRLLLVDWVLIHGGLHWSLIDLATKLLIQDSQLPTPRQPLKDFDGITRDGSGGFQVTLIDDPRIWHLPAKGTQIPMSETAIDGIDLDYQDGWLAVPRVSSSLSLFRLHPSSTINAE